MKRVGIGEALIGNIYLDDVTIGNVKALSEEWWGMVEHAIREGGRIGVDIGFFNCPGRSQSGGPWIQPHQAMRYLASAERRVKGPASFKEKLEKPAEEREKRKVFNPVEYSPCEITGESYPFKLVIRDVLQHSGSRRWNLWKERSLKWKD